MAMENDNTVDRKTVLKKRLRAMLDEADAKRKISGKLKLYLEKIRKERSEDLKKAEQYLKIADSLRGKKIGVVSMGEYKKLKAKAKARLVAVKIKDQSISEVLQRIDIEDSYVRALEVMIEQVKKDIVGKVVLPFSGDGSKK